MSGFVSLHSSVSVSVLYRCSLEEQPNVGWGRVLPFMDYIGLCHGIGYGL